MLYLGDMDPRYRFTLVMGLLMLGWWAYVVVSTYLFGARGLNLERYQEGVLLVGGAAAVGFALVWATARLIEWQRNRKTGFEADVVDEFNTGFAMSGADGKPEPFKLSLSKFLPQLVAPPNWPGLTPLEAELIGFLNAYRHWPMDIENPETSLYEQAFARWQVMRHLPGTGPWHRVVALSRDLALIYAYQEQRTTFPFYEFWKRDRVKFTQRCTPHGGMTAFVLSTLPAFRALASTSEGALIQRSLLTCMRYHQTPAMLPLNAGPMARELLDYLWRADAELKQLDVEYLDEMTPERIEALKKAVGEQWLGVLGDIVLGKPGDEGVQAFKQAGGTYWLKQETLLGLLGGLLPPQLRQVLKLWDTKGGVAHPAWVHLAPLLQDLNLIANVHDGIAAMNGCFNLRVSGVPFGVVVKLTPHADQHLPVLQLWNKVEGSPLPVEVVLDNSQLVAVATTKAGELDAKLGTIF